ncbi:adenosine receptor A1-like [Actinia tenebrosa]|uniref:Adenosine receptor A1-like n=1 Tax=Actinia tenebrosa TaxID=6105 RepID=A0A6P8IRB9_ACTTE|nr:adenosine receptor A1-like [Actinia tenebrosa]
MNDVRSVNGTQSVSSVMASTPNQTISSFQCPITFDFDPTNITHLPASVVPTWISVIAVNVVTSPLTVLINLLVIWTVVENEQLKSNSYYLLVAILSLSDLLVGLVIQPLFIALIICVINQCTYVCELIMAYTLSALLCYGWTAVTMVIVSLERYFFIEHPLYYQTSVTPKKLMIASAASWALVGISRIFIRFLMNESFWVRQLPGILLFGPSFVIIVFCVSKVHLTARRQMRAIVAQQQSVAMKQSKIKEYKRTFTLGLIVLASVACLCPLLVLKIVGAVKGNFNDDIRYTSQAIYFTILHLQSIINPIIYSLRLSDIRTGVAKRLQCNRQ